MISKVLFDFGYYGIWKFIHNFFCALTLILVGIHCGLEWDLLSGMIKKLIKIPNKIAKPLGIIGIILILIVGVYSIGTTDFGKWMTDPFTYNESNHTGDGHGNGEGLGIGNNGTVQHKNSNNQTDSNNENISKGKHDGSGQGKQLNKLNKTKNVSDNQTGDHKNNTQNLNDNKTLDNNQLSPNNILPLNTVNWESMGILMIQIASIIGLFAIITRGVMLIFKK